MPHLIPRAGLCPRPPPGLIKRRRPKFVPVNGPRRSKRERFGVAVGVPWRPLLLPRLRRGVRVPSARCTHFRFLVLGSLIPEGRRSLATADHSLTPSNFGSELPPPPPPPRSDLSFAGGRRSEGARKATSPTPCGGFVFRSELCTLFREGPGRGPPSSLPHGSYAARSHIRRGGREWSPTRPPFMS